VNAALEVVLAVVVILAALLAVTSLASRGRKLKCPECGTVFRPPAMDNKRSGLGWTFPYTGTVKCPKCGESRGRRDYLKATNQPPT
jgi:uncharacterized C2H2 Zn-finger protein